MNIYYNIILSEIRECDMCANDVSYILGACDFAFRSKCISFEERSQLLDIAMSKHNAFRRLQEV